MVTGVQTCALPIFDKGSVKLIDSATGEKVTTLKVAGEGTWEVLADGKVRFTTDNGFTGNPKAVQYVVSDADKNESEPASITVTYDGTTPPPANVKPAAAVDRKSVV